MKIVIAVFLLLGAVGSGIAASEHKEKLYIFLAALISMILHLWFGVSILISL